MIYEYQKDEFVLTTDPKRLDLDVIHSYLVRSYWNRGIPKELVAQSIEHSMNFGLFKSAQQIGLARVVTDHTHFAYLCDFFILEPYQGLGLGRWMLESILACPNLQGLRNFLLTTADAHTFYRQQGFHLLDQPERWMKKQADRPWFQPD